MASGDSENSNGNTKIVWWLLSAFGGLMTVMLSVMVFQRINELDARARMNAEAIAKLQEAGRQWETLVAATRAEQVSRTNIFGELQSKIATVELSNKLLDNQVKMLSERVQALASSPRPPPAPLPREPYP